MSNDKKSSAGIPSDFMTATKAVTDAVEKLQTCTGALQVAKDAVTKAQTDYNSAAANLQAQQLLLAQVSSQYQ